MRRLILVGWLVVRPCPTDAMWLQKDNDGSMEEVRRVKMKLDEMSGSADGVRKERGLIRN